MYKSPEKLGVLWTQVTTKEPPGTHSKGIQLQESLAPVPENGKPRGSNIQFNLKQAQVANNSQKFLGEDAFVFKTLTLKKRPCNFFALMQVIREQRNLKILSGWGPDSGVLPWHSLSHNSQEGGKGGGTRGQVSICRGSWFTHGDTHSLT